MLNKRKSLSSFLIMVLFGMIQLISPGGVKATAISAEGPTEQHSLLKTNETIKLSNNIEILKGTHIYGVVNDQEVEVKYADDSIYLPINYFEKEDITENAPVYYDEPIGFLVESSNSTKEMLFSSIETENTASIKIISDDEVPIYKQDSGLKVLFIGNTLFYLQETDTPVSDQDKESKDSEILNPDTNKDDNSDTNKDDNSGLNNNNKASQPNNTEKQLEGGQQKNNDVQRVELKENKNQEIALKVKVNPWAGNPSEYFKADTHADIYDNRTGSLIKVGELVEGQVYRRISDYGADWHQIQFGDIFGYVYKPATSVASRKDIPNLNTSYKNQIRIIKATETLTVYDNSSGSLIPFGVINKGTSYPVVSDYGDWWRVLLGDRVGYIYKGSSDLEFVKEDKYFKANTRADIYDNRTGSLIKVGELVEGQVYRRISDYGGDWHQIQFGDIFGYVYKPATSVASGQNILNLDQKQKKSIRSFEAIDNLTIYDNTSGRLVPFGILDRGTKYTVTSDYGAEWWQVTFSGRIGYVAKSGTKVNQTKQDQYFRAFNNLPIFDNRTGKLIKVGNILKNQTYRIVKDYGDWWQVQLGDFYGYVYKTDTGFATSSEIRNLNRTLTNTQNKFETKSNVTVYDNTSGSLVPFGVIDKNTIYSIANDYGEWLEIIYLGRVGYIYADAVEKGIKSVPYNLTLYEALDIQLYARAQTDKNYGYVSKEFIVNNKVTTDILNVRSGAGTSNAIVGQLRKNESVKMLGEYNNWYIIDFKPNMQWINATPGDILYYLDPLNFINDEKQIFQFLNLAKPTNTNAATLNNFLRDKGILSGLGQAFIDASNLYSINEIYLISHALLETGNGESRLARGIIYNGVTVYNMFGIGAYDGENAVLNGAKYAYDNGWTSPYKAIVGGAKFIGNDYIQSSLNTIYKMRWNPEAMEKTGRFGPQYATDVGWAYKQVNTIYYLYQQIDYDTLFLEIPEYKK